LEEGIHSLEYDLGYEAADIVKRDYRSAFEKRLEELTQEEAPLAATFESRQIRRREVLRTRLVKASVAFGTALLVFIACVVATIVFALKIPTVPDSTGYIVTTAICGGVSLLTFIIGVFFFNKFKNALGIYLVNERLSSTEEGARLEEIRAYKALYEALLADGAEAETEDE
jgi:multidrug transporter EmrE-like cation transporter